MSFLLVAFLATLMQSPVSPSPTINMADDHASVGVAEGWLGKLLNNFHGAGLAAGASMTYERRVPGCNAFSKLSMGVMAGVNFLSFSLRGFRVRRASVLASLMVVVLLAGGCATENEDGGEQSPSPANQETSAEPEATPEPEGTPTVVEVDPPVKPEAMSSDGEGGAVAALEYFLDVLGYSYVTRDTTLLDDISYDQCGFCENNKSEIQKLIDNDLQYKNAVWKLEEVVSIEQNSDYDQLFALRVRYAVTTSFYGDKSDVTVEAESIFDIGRTGDVWELISVVKA